MMYSIDRNSVHFFVFLRSTFQSAFSGDLRSPSQKHVLKQEADISPTRAVLLNLNFQKTNSISRETDATRCW